MEAGSRHLEEPKGHNRSASDSESGARWNRIIEIVGASWEMGAEARAAFIAERCGTDESMRAEVESLLGQQQHQSSFLKSDFAGTLRSSTPEVALGSLLGPYRIEEKIGEGGMGVVFRAFDTRLERKVAVKVLRSFATEDESARKRFLQEARMAAALNDPHIVSVYDVGSSGDTDFIAMEYVSGTTLDRLLASSRLSLKEALRYAEQIAQALAGAHSLGIVHRDLKPGNVIVGGDGNAKVLDFGLAKRIGESVQPPAASGLPAAQGQAAVSNMTLMGTVLGTISYMSPEQARGEPVDERSDIFSFGSVLFEMISGRKAFAGSNHEETIEAILHSRPPRLHAFPRAAPHKIDELVSACLRKNPSERPRSSDVLAAIRRMTAGHRLKLPFLAVIASAICILLAGLWTIENHKTPESIDVATPVTGNAGLESEPAFSPDGKYLAYSWTGLIGSNVDIYVKAWPSGPAQRLTTSVFRDFNPVWSPDGKQIAYRRELPSGIFEIRLMRSDGRDDRLVASTGPFRLPCTTGLAWAREGNWLVASDVSAPRDAGALYRIDIRSGQKKRLTSPPPDILGDCDQAFSWSGNRLSFSRWAQYEVSDVWVMDISRDGTLTGTPRSLTRGNQKSVTTAWLPGDREILFQSGFDDAVLMRVRCCGGDKPRMIGIAGEEGHHPTISRSGDLVFNRQRLAYDIYSVPLRGDGLAAAPPAKLITSTRVDTDARYSPDGRELIFSSNRNGPPEIWRADADGSRPVPLTHLNSVTRHGRWSPDGTKIVFESNVAGNFDLYTTPAGGGPVQRLTFDPSAEQEPSWSPDGRWIYFVSNRTGREQVFRMPAEGGRAEIVVQSEVPLHEPVIWRDFLYYLAQGKSSLAVMRRSLRTGKQELVRGGVDYMDYVPSDYGIYIGTRAENGYEFRLVRDDGRVSLMLKGKRPFSRPCVSPDGTRLVYSLLEEYSKTLYWAKIE